MKKLNYLLLGAAGLLMASCSNEEPAAAPAQGDGTVTLSISLPAEMATRANLGSGLAATNLTYYIYEVSGTTNTLQDIVTEEEVFKNTTSTLVTLDLLKGKEYNIVFFAANGAAFTEGSTGVYTINSANGNLTVDYTKMTSTDNNNDVYDCFYAVYNVTPETYKASDVVTLNRPVAQINWGTSDLGSALVQKAYLSNGASIWTSLEITDAPTTLNMITGVYSGRETATIGTFAIPEDQSFPVKGYSYVGSQYVLANGTYNLELTIANAEENAKENTPVSVSNVPLKPNYQTNIYGALLTNPANLNVTIDNSFTITNDIDTNFQFDEETGTITCITPVLPEGVTPDDFTQNDAGAVAISADGTPVYIAGNSKAISDALKNDGITELYFAPNAEIPSQGYRIVIQQGGLTVHGNGATITGSTIQFSIDNTGNAPTNLYTEGSTVDINISNLNNAEVWGDCRSKDVTFNIYMKNCTMSGTGLDDTNTLIMTRGQDDDTVMANITLDNCYAQNILVGAHSTYVGNIVVKNCKFKNVGIPINYAKKLEDRNGTVTVLDCDFDTCGIAEGEVSAWNYAAPVRVVDNGGPADSVSVLVDGCTFTGTKSQWDILLMDYRSGKVWFPVKYTITNCDPADPTIRATEAIPGQD